MCEHCGARSADFWHQGYAYCCECVSELCSWLLDGGTTEIPDLFPEITQETTR